MSGVRPQHLQRRDGTYHLRVRVPSDLKLRVGMLEVRRSLHVHSLSQGRRLVAKFSARVLEVFDMLRVQDFTREEARALVAACFHDLAAEVDGGYVCRTPEPQMEIDDQRLSSQEVITDLQWQDSVGVFEGSIRYLANDLLSGRGRKLEELSPAMQVTILSGVVRALIERERLFQFRFAERILPYTPNDPLFEPAVNGAEPDLTPAAERRADPAVARHVGPTMNELVEKYLQVKRQEWTPKTHRARTRQLSYLVEQLGADTSAAAVTPAEIREFRDAVTRLRANHHVGPRQSFLARQTENQKQRIASKTVSVIFETAKAVFRWASSEAYIGTNPAADIRVGVAKTVKGKRPRTPFSVDQLKVLFSAPVFVGCRSVKRRFEPGTWTIRDAYFWVPLIAYFTGARLGEIIQMHLDDVKLDGPIPYIEITEEGGDGEQDIKHVKSDAGVRQVPLHPDLMSLGFAEFVARRRTDKRSSQRLFWEIGYGADGQPSTLFSKWFARLLDKVGLTEPNLVFHSFRHGSEDAFRNALTPQYIIDQLIGHSDGATSAGYGEGVWLEVAYEAVRRMRLPVDVPALWAVPAPGT